MILARTEPRARTLAQRRAALAKAAISPTNWPSRRTATRYSRWPRDSVDITSRDRDAPCAWDQACERQKVKSFPSTTYTGTYRAPDTPCIRFMNRVQIEGRASARRGGAA